MRSFLILIMMLSTVLLPAQAPRSGELYLGMDIREFSQVFPDLAPRSLAFTGHFKLDTVWQGATWEARFSFGADHLNDAFFRSAPLPLDYLAELHQKVRQELSGYYGTPESSPAAFKLLPPDSLADPDSLPQALPTLRWKVKKSLFQLQQTVDQRLELRLNGLTRYVEGTLTIDAPMFVGMPLGTFAVFHPHVVAQGVGYNGLRQRPDKFGDMNGFWFYWFRLGKLDDMYFQAAWNLGPGDEPEHWEYVQRYTEELISKMKEASGEPLHDISIADSVLVEHHYIQRGATWRLGEASDQKVLMHVRFLLGDGIGSYGYRFRFDYDWE